MLNKKLMILMGVVALGAQQVAYAAFDASGYGKDVATAQKAQETFEMVSDPKAGTPQGTIDDYKENWVSACNSLGGNKFWGSGKDVISDVNRLAAYDACGGLPEFQKKHPNNYAILKDAKGREAAIKNRVEELRVEAVVRQDAKNAADLEAAAAALRRGFGFGKK